MQAVPVAIGRLGGAAEVEAQKTAEFEDVFDLVMPVLFQPDKPGGSGPGKSYLSPADKYALRATNSLVNDMAYKVENIAYREVYNIKCVGHSRLGCHWLWKEYLKEYKLSKKAWPAESCMPGDCHCSDDECGMTLESITEYYKWMAQAHDY